MAVSVVTICNLALQMLGAARITSLDEDSVNARACNACYEMLRRSELREHPWNCAKSRAALAADATAPSWGRANSFALPADFLALIKPYPEDNDYTLDYEIEGRSILSDEDAPLYIRYIADVTDVSQMDPLLQEAIATRMAIQMCEEITNSNTKKNFLKDDYKIVIAKAKRSNAIEGVPAVATSDEWLEARERG